MSLDLALSIGTLILLALAAYWVHLALFDRYFKLTYIDAPIWSLFYFAFWIGTATLIFPSEMRALFEPIHLFGYVVLAFCLLAVFPYVYRTLRQKIGNPQWLASLFPSQGMLTLEERYIISKIGDVVFQQSLIGIMILTLVHAGFSYPHVVGIFLLFFVPAHLFIFRTAGFLWGMHYTTYAAVGGFAFPFLIIFVPGGIACAVLLHMLFYVLSAAFFAKLPKPNAAICREYMSPVAMPKH